MIGKFFQTPKHRQFNIPYRYYDPAKEGMQEREDRIKRELGIHDKKKSDENYRSNIRGQFRRSMGESAKSATDARSRSNSRLITLIIILGIATFLFFKF